VAKENGAKAAAAQESENEESESEGNLIDLSTPEEPTETK
jgi:hypothetical protein